jgi:multisubunit Na+/H+ antiporter MnhE subunit
VSRFLLALVPLVLVYALVLASFHPWDLGIGTAAGAALLWGTRRFTFGESIAPVADWPRRAVWFVPFAAITVWEMTKGTWNVALVVLHLRPLAHPGLVVLPFEERTRLGVAVWALAITLSPGSFPVEFDWDKRIMLVHFLDASDPDAIRSDQLRLYRRYQRRVFP